jgi:hypothetical protein
MSEHSVAPTRAQHAASMVDYLRKGERLAQNLGNRGPIRFDTQGKIHPDILDAFNEHGFYIFESVIEPAEIEALRADVNSMIERAPVTRDAKVDTLGRPALGLDFARNPYTFIKPLSDPWGGTKALGGRHPSQMTQPAPDSDAPADVIHLLYGMCQTMKSALRLYGHPRLLAIAEAINGPDFVPYNDAIFVKQPGLGGSVAWHQDGVTHWNTACWDPGIHGFNFQVQLYPCTAANGLWVVPGTHKAGRIDIKKMVEDNGGSDRLPGAVPLVCEAGDVTIVNRQMLHGSFANTSRDLRISITFGFHRRASVLGQKAVLAVESDAIYDEQRILERAAVIAVAIDSRAKHYPQEKSFLYQPFIGLEDEYRFTDETFQRVIYNYNVKDLAI